MHFILSVPGSEKQRRHMGSNSWNLIPGWLGSTCCFRGGRLKHLFSYTRCLISHHTDVNNKVNICKRYSSNRHFHAANRLSLLDQTKPEELPGLYFFHGPLSCLSALPIEPGSCRTGVYLDILGLIIETAVKFSFKTSVHQGGLKCSSHALEIR